MTLRTRSKPFPKTLVPGAKKMTPVFVNEWIDGTLRRQRYWLTPAQMNALRDYRRRKDELGARQYIIDNGKKG